METSVVKGLASHSSIMIAPQELTSECEEGWTVVSSKRTLQKLRKIKKSTNKKYKSTDHTSAEEQKEPKISSANNSVKSASSRESWSSVERALKMDM